MTVKTSRGGFVPHALEALKAGRLTMLMVRLFGKKRTYIEEDTLIVVKTWRGKAYLIRCLELPPRHINCRCAVIPHEGGTK